MTADYARSAPLRPARLFAGARVALVAPAGPIHEDRLEGALAHCREFGLEPVPGASILARTGYLAGSDELRAADLQRAIDDPTVDAIWAIRGGYGALRILPRVDWSAMTERPRPYIGFSDNTAVHLALAARNVMSFHAPHPGSSFPDFSRAAFRSVLFEGAIGCLPLPAAANPVTLRSGVATGRLIGGNLALLAALAGTPWALRARDCIVLLEDVGEAVYRIDRALVQLILSGALEGVAGFAIGQFTERPVAQNDRDLRDVITELLEPFGVPILAGLPFGHIDEQWSLPIGALARMDAAHGILELLEPGVA